MADMKRINRLRRKTTRLEQELAYEVLQDVLHQLDSHADPGAQVAAAYEAVRRKAPEWLEVRAGEVSFKNRPVPRCGAR